MGNNERHGLVRLQAEHSARAASGNGAGAKEWAASLAASSYFTSVSVEWAACSIFLHELSISRAAERL
jgi:hypothetical protein